MAFKYQILLCPRPRDLLLISYNHMDALREFVKDTPIIANQVDETHRKIIEVVNKDTVMAGKGLKKVTYCMMVSFSIQLRTLNSNLLLQVYTPLSESEFQLLRQTLLIFFQDMHVRVSVC